MNYLIEAKIFITFCYRSVRERYVLCLFFIFIQFLPTKIFSQDQSKQPQDISKSLPNGTDGLTFYPRIVDTVFVNKASDLPWNEFEGRYSTFKIGAGYIGDFTAYSEDRVFRQQMDSLGINLTPTYQTRDFRVLGSGRLLKTKRYIAWKFAYMYDGDQKVWMIRETGVTIGVPELKGNFFIGRTKEGFSMIKVMNGHSGITNERQMALDPVPILADGIKYFGFFPKSRLFMNLGIYNDFLSKGQGFSTFKQQYVARVGWLPVNDTKTDQVLHIATNLRYGYPLNGEFTVKSRPESNPTPQLINTGKFPADRASTVGGEIYYRNKNFMIGSEFMQHNFYADKSDDHHFAGGDIMVSYIITGAHRPYNTNTGNVFGFVPVKKSVFKGGLGEIEFVFRASTFDLNDKTIQGGKFTRYTPMINWYLSKTIRWELIYGFGTLDRFGLTGHVQFYETRIQFSFL
jgi:phosphate-selective porin OprO and OprP